MLFFCCHSLFIVGLFFSMVLLKVCHLNSTAFLCVQVHKVMQYGAAMQGPTIKMRYTYIYLARAGQMVGMQTRPFHVDTASNNGQSHGPLHARVWPTRLLLAQKISETVGTNVFGFTKLVTDKRVYLSDERVCLLCWSSRANTFTFGDKCVHLQRQACASPATNAFARRN